MRSVIWHDLRVHRFITLGTESGTYYVNAKTLTADNAEFIIEYAAEHTAVLVREIVEISTSGRAPGQHPALFALAAAASLGDVDGRRAAFAALPLVARTGTHLFLFAGYAEQFRGWGRGLRRAVAYWYLDKPVEDLAFQVVKYRQREGWSNRDLLRLSHPATIDDDRRRLFDWICGRAPELDGGLPISAREASAALVLVTARTEPQHQIVGFTSGGRGWQGARGLSELAISPRQRLDDAVRAVSNLPFGGTDCSLPILHALDKGIEVDVFSIYTDSETWAGTVHPHQALARYRREVNPRAKLVVVGMTATKFSIADPDDAGMLDVAGFDAAVPSLLADFATGA
ncbi:TROVE domain-containing protein [Nocardia sp. FBN12]|uniref:TROVE domain-containing protein n=1 Tax=Nocardia sp. FBN12 TaxID=3419766 RepID=UPI003D04A827